ncbi:MAG: PEP/pyruvate-binding domain-containing protein [Bacteroidota bacterium]
MRIARLFPVFLLSFFVLTQVEVLAQEPSEIAELISRLRQEDRGPYMGIRWFCADGSVLHPRIEGNCPNPDPDNKQHAKYLPEIEQLGRKKHIFLGQILTATDRNEFWDETNDHDRLKQYMLGNYLGRIDNGWIQEKSQYYRGAFQIEDERAWGRDFLAWLMRNQEVLRGDFYLLREAVKDIPHGEESDIDQRIRDRSRILSDAYEDFLDLRVKIHGQPTISDAAAVRKFMAANESDLREEGLYEQMDTLAQDIETAYSSENAMSLISAAVSALSNNSPFREQAEHFLDNFKESEIETKSDITSVLTRSAELMWAIRREIGEETYRENRLALLDLSIELERLIFRLAPRWEPAHARELMEKACYLTEAAAGAGLIESWEYEQVESAIGDFNYQYVFLDHFESYVDLMSRIVSWGAATNRATFGPTVDKYAEFEPLATDFLDDRVRGSVLLPLGEAASFLTEYQATTGSLGSDLPAEVQNINLLRGVNPGYARGKLYVIESSGEELEVDPKGIYVFQRPPADLKPVAGLLTVSEGNLVSHVQLLARNLGIPNAIIANDQFADFKQLDGDEFFYAVSPAGGVILRPIDEMTEEEQALFTEYERSEDRVTVDNDRLDLAANRVLNMSRVNSRDSGVRCGPKAANLGQLKQLFPDQVVEGLVIPFGIFREHLDQEMPDQNGLSYWQFLNRSFEESRQLEAQGSSQSQVDEFLMGKLATMREALENIRLKPELIRELRDSFQVVFGGSMGRVPVFLRSDTNMEDLPEFTGAGLNLTLFNVLDEATILDGIKRIWASPYTERSYLWRQRYLTNPENVFPSILIIPTVDVASSGVLITKGILDGDPLASTVAFSRGAGGAVEGQAAESYRLGPSGQPRLLSPARERIHRRLPATGGSKMTPNDFSERILSTSQLQSLHELSIAARNRMPDSPGVSSDGPWDIELGFEDEKIWLFQIRPFVENKRAQSSDYLESISPQKEAGLYIDMEYGFGE